MTDYRKILNVLEECELLDDSVDADGYKKLFVKAEDKTTGKLETVVFSFNNNSELEEITINE